MACSFNVEASMAFDRKRTLERGGESTLETTAGRLDSTKDNLPAVVHAPRELTVAPRAPYAEVTPVRHFMAGGKNSDLRLAPQSMTGTMFPNVDGTAHKWNNPQDPRNHEYDYLTRWPVAVSDFIGVWAYTIAKPIEMVWQEYKKHGAKALLWGVVAVPASALAYFYGWIPALFAVGQRLLFGRSSFPRFRDIFVKK